jgi:hypothetical protein
LSLREPEKRIGYDANNLEFRAACYVSLQLHCIHDPHIVLLLSDLESVGRGDRERYRDG